MMQTRRILNECVNDSPNIAQVLESEFVLLQGLGARFVFYLQLGRKREFGNK